MTTRTRVEGCATKTHVYTARYVAQLSGRHCAGARELFTQQVQVDMSTVRTCMLVIRSRSHRPPMPARPCASP
eukprot:2555045-Pyramimonas_sp.AAC.1